MKRRKMYMIRRKNTFFKTCALVVYFWILTFVATTEASFDYDHFEYVQEWPPSMLLRQNLSSLPSQRSSISKPSSTNIWTIHGLWPDEGRGRMENCNSSWHFDVNQIKSIKANMEKYWPSWKKSWTDEDFWCHEWTSHGTCAAEKPALDSQLKYFTKALQLRDLADIDQALRSRNIIPDNKKQYMVNNFDEALAAKFGEGAFFINCDMEGNSQIISDVRVCINTSYQFTRCPDLPTYEVNTTHPNSNEKVALTTWNNSEHASVNSCTLLCKCSKTLLYPIRLS